MELEKCNMLKNNTEHSIDIEFKDLTYQVKIPKQKEKKTILKGISGTFRSGQLTAIMGPSGAGKSSLMNILTGFTKTGVSGTVNFGNAHNARKVCCYIMQDDTFYTFYTVEEIMMLGTNLKISYKAMTIKEKKLLIENILVSLKLTNTKHTRCGRLSGGQKKRLSIALELIDNPAILFLDEPTTGLDSYSSFDTIQLLQTLANEGRTVVCSIHQPSSNIYSLFNQIYVMSHGYCTYQGRPDKTVEYLKSVGLECPPYHNPADYLLECVNGDYGDYTEVLNREAQKIEWRHDYHVNREDSITSTSNNNEAQVVKISKASKYNGQKNLFLSYTTNKHMYPPPEWMRLWLLIGRCHVQIYRDWTIAYLKLFAYILCAILTGATFSDSGSNADKQISNFSSFVFHSIFLWHTTLMAAVLRYPLEIAIIKKESFNNWYKLKTFYLATSITSGPVQIIISSVYTTITYVMTDQPLELERFVKMILTVMVLTVCADAVGVLLGTILNPVNGTFVSAVVSCFGLMYSGFLITLRDMSDFMKTVSYASPIRFCLGNMMLSVYENNRADTICPDNVIYCHFKNAALLLKTLGMENSNYAMNLLILGVQLVIFKCCAFITLKRKVKSH